MYQFLSAPVINTDRLLIRIVDLTDANFYFKICSNYNVCRFLTFNPYRTINETKIVINNMIRAYIQGRDLNLSIVLKSTNEVIGSISLTFDKMANKADVGYILDESYWHNGYMSEALRSLINVSKEYYKLDYLTASYLQENNASSNLLLKNGFKIDEIITNGFFKNNVFYNLVKTSLAL